MTAGRIHCLTASTLVCMIGIFLFTFAPCRGAQSKPYSDDQVVETLSINEMEDVLEAEGYTDYELGEDTIILKMDDTKVLMIFPDKRNSIQMVALFDYNTTLEKVNEWNKNYKYAKIYLDEDNDMVLELDLDLTGGVTIARVKDFLLTFKVVLTAFYDEDW